MVAINSEPQDHQTRLAEAVAELQRLRSQIAEAMDSTKRSLSRLKRLTENDAPGSYVRRECAISAERMLVLGRLWERQCDLREDVARIKQEERT